ncbi:MAG: bifunctional adenosylcobinamide kinase/adenosylcobinamide-phosphate guanylyltransferase [Desulfotignum sp.]|nr:bifunctional adenosylcobinamide kinase/adenosylcobinamide-phosphate guanylyltransferase [Desulfotignum sp.]
MTDIHPITLVIGGCRSGKSRYALNAANAFAGGSKVFLATSVPRDREMEQRVHSHQAERGRDWQTVEEPVKIHEKITAHADTADVILVDCLTLWLSNMLAANMDEAGIQTCLDRTVQALSQTRCPVFLVTNEVGCAIVPENSLARRFRDLAGMVNQQMAQAADQVVLTVAGIALQIKPER